MKKQVVFLVISFFVFVTYLVVDTYAIFESKITTPTENSLAKWVIDVNNSKINGEENNFNVNNVIWSTSSYVLPGKAAPSLDAYFNLVINPEGTEVSVKYDITFDWSNIQNEEFKLVSVVDLEDSEIVRTDEFTYSGIISLEEIENEEFRDIKVNLVWNNVETNNENDSKMSNLDIMIPVSIRFSQYFGEELVEYTD